MVTIFPNTRRHEIRFETLLINVASNACPPLAVGEAATHKRHHLPVGREVLGDIPVGFDLRRGKAALRTEITTLSGEQNG
jgi:hypothetical protein